MFMLHICQISVAESQSKPLHSMCAELVLTHMNNQDCYQLHGCTVAVQKQSLERFGMDINGILVES